MTSAGLTEVPVKRIRKVFCHIWPKPCSGLSARCPSTFRLRAPVGVLPTFIVEACCAQYAMSRGCTLVDGIGSVVMASPSLEKYMQQNLYIRIVERFYRVLY